MSSTVRFPDTGWFARHRARRRRQVASGDGALLEMGLEDPLFRRCLELSLLGDLAAAQEQELLAALERQA